MLKYGSKLKETTSRKGRVSKVHSTKIDYEKDGRTNEQNIKKDAIVKDYPESKQMNIIRKQIRSLCEASGVTLNTDFKEMSDYFKD